MDLEGWIYFVNFADVLSNVWSMKRYIYQQLIDWKNSPSRKPLMLYGARQVGKTYILKEFGRKEFDNLVYVNCYKNPQVEAVFAQDVDVRRIVRDLSVLTGQEILPEKSLLFFDEVQEIPDVVAALKYFCEDMPSLCIATAGSLLGVMNMEGVAFPTGKVDIMDMYPMTFHEFLEAKGLELKVELLRDPNARTSINALAPSYVDLLRQYYFVGGMPEAVKEFIHSEDLQKVRKIQKDILTAYDSDIAKHAGKDAVKARMVFESIPSQLARENKKFIYGAVRPGARAARFEDAIQWLVDARIAYKVCRVSKAALPLKFYIEFDTFKLFLIDVGLLGAAVNTEPSQVLFGDSIFSEYKGAFTENFVLTQLKTLQGGELAYYAKDGSKIEVDFLFQYRGQLIPIEVKAEENVKSKSFRQFLTVDYADSGMKGIRYSMKGFADQGWMENRPLFSLPSF